jgi:ABC-type transporter Mla subunit MlaD
MAQSEQSGREQSGAGEQAAAAADSLKESAAHIAEQQKETGARQLSGIAGAVHAAADQLEDQLPGAAGYIHDAAERIDSAASDLRNRNLSDIAESIRRLGQERPLAMFGGAVLAGFVMTRFLKSGQSGADRGDSWNRDSQRT